MGGQCPMMMGGLMVLGWVVFVAAVVAGVVLVVRAVGGRGPAGGDASNEAMSILEQRFARGEIDGDEFAEKRRVLSE